MTATRARYRYPLVTLEALYAHRLEQARLSLAAAQRRLDQHQGQIEQLRSALGRSLKDWTAASERATRFDPASHAAVRESLAVHHSKLRVALAHERELRAEVKRSQEQTAQAYRRTQIVARHKELSKREFELEVVRSDQREADAAWPSWRELL